jgi:hypothetical protein
MERRVGVHGAGGLGKGLVLAAVVVLTGAAAAADASGPVPSERVVMALAAPDDRIADLDDPAASSSPTAADETVAAATVIGRAIRGERVTLSAKGSKGQALRFRWVQTAGPKVAIDRPEAAEVAFRVPSEGGPLAFHVIVAGLNGVDLAEVEVPVSSPERMAPSLPTVVTANAGDDQVAVVGHRVALDGRGSRPRDRGCYRWVQLDGPPVRERVDEAWVCSFVPDAPGLHRFQLIVASDGAIAAPDEVLVAVVPESDAPGELKSPFARPAETRARELLVRADPNGRFARDLADAFDAVADRSALYRAYGDAASELSRRIDAVLPPTSPNRRAWDHALFEPLSEPVAEALVASGFDPAAQVDRPLTAGQRRRLSDTFHDVARGFRAVDPALAGAAGKAGSRPR